MSFVSSEHLSRWMAGEARPDEALLRRYGEIQSRATLSRLFAGLFGKRTTLRSLDELLAGRRLHGSRAAGLQSVPIAAIVASEGRTGDFDARFRPLRADSWDRWRSVALAVVRGDTLPPVELIAVDGRYAVRDGHHRISVAAALGQREVDALVTIVQM